MALYGSGSGYNQGSVSFKLSRTGNRRVVLRLTGLDDERLERCQLQVVINGTTIFDGPNTFPNVPNTDNGIGGKDRLWGQMTIPIPVSILTTSQSTLILRNATPWEGALGIPYMLINSVEFVEE